MCATSGNSGECIPSMGWRGQAQCPIRGAVISALHTENFGSPGAPAHQLHRPLDGFRSAVDEIDGVQSGSGQPFSQAIRRPVLRL